MNNQQNVDFSQKFESLEKKISDSLARFDLIEKESVDANLQKLTDSENARNLANADVIASQQKSAECALIGLKNLIEISTSPILLGLETKIENLKFKLEQKDLDCNLSSMLEVFTKGNREVADEDKYYISIMIGPNIVRIMTEQKLSLSYDFKPDEIWDAEYRECLEKQDVMNSTEHEVDSVFIGYEGGVTFTKDAPADMVHDSGDYAYALPNSAAENFCSELAQYSDLRNVYNNVVFAILLKQLEEFSNIDVITLDFQKSFDQFLLNIHKEITLRLNQRIENLQRV